MHRIIRRKLPLFINGYLFFLSTFLFSFSFSLNTDFTILLAFKSSSDTSNSLISWNITNSNSTLPCSSWLGVTCHPTSHRVTKLVLNNLNLTGSIQTLTQLSQLRHLSLHHNHLSSSSTLNFTSTWPKLRHLYLAHNHFTGKFPPGISHFRGLRRLDLSYNGFFGEIPVTELTQLPHLLTLRLEFNSFNGTLKSFMPSSLSDFNISENSLAGKIPYWLSNFPASAFVGNGRLCGKPLPGKCPVIIPSAAAGRGPRGPQQLPIGVADINNNNNKKKKSSRNRMILMIILADAGAIILIILAIGSWCYYNKRFRNEDRKNSMMKRFNSSTSSSTRIYGPTMEINGNGEMVFFEGCKGFNKVDELLKASAEMLGKGSVGTTYRVAMDGGIGGGGGDVVVVVKRVREKVKRVKEIGGYLREIGGLRHPNVVCLRAYYSSKEELLLVYDFLHNGSLHNLLHGNRGPGRTPLDWPKRLKFALGSAQGLAYIHGYTKSKLFHGHLTSSNIIIDSKGNACISDIGLHQLLQVPALSNNAYKAPELLINNNANHNQARKFTQKSDVYSFGVILLEILTGRMATTSEGETSLAKWVQKVAREEWNWDVFDFELVRHKEMEKEMMELLKVAMLCLASSPKDRPKMTIVQKKIEDIINGSKRVQSVVDFEQFSYSSMSL